MRYILLIFFVLKLNNCIAQINLVPNPSFEDTIGTCNNQMAITQSWSNVKRWQTDYYSSSPDYHNTCSNSLNYPFICTVPYNSRGYQYPRSGNAYLGIYSYGILNSTDSSYMVIDYATVKLNQALQTNKCYYGEMYISLANISELAINQFSIFLTQNTYSSSALSYFNNSIQPQIQWDTTQFFTDTLNWVKVSGKFTAQGGEQYLTIGNFKDGTHVKKRSISSNFIPAFGGWPQPRFFTYILADDVALYEIPKPNLGNDINRCGATKDSLQIGDATLTNNGLNVHWYKNGTLLSNLTNTINIAATQPATYIVEYEGCTADTLIVNYQAHCPTTSIAPTKDSLITPNVISPNGDGINDYFIIQNLPNNTCIIIYNRWGNELLNTTNYQNNFPLTDVSAGVYYYVIKQPNGSMHNGYLTVFR